MLKLCFTKGCMQLGQKRVFQLLTFWRKWSQMMQRLENFVYQAIVTFSHGHEIPKIPFLSAISTSGWKKIQELALFGSINRYQNVIQLFKTWHFAWTHWKIRLLIDKLVHERRIKRVAQHNVSEKISQQVQRRESRTIFIFDVVQTSVNIFEFSGGLNERRSRSFEWASHHGITSWATRSIG